MDIENELKKLKEEVNNVKKRLSVLKEQTVPKDDFIGLDTRVNNLETRVTSIETDVVEKIKTCTSDVLLEMKKEYSILSTAVLQLINMNGNFDFKICDDQDKFLSI